MAEQHSKPPIQLSSSQRRDGERIADMCRASGSYILLAVRIRGVAEMIAAGRSRPLTADEWNDLGAELASHLAAVMRIEDDVRDGK